LAPVPKPAPHFLAIFSISAIAQNLPESKLTLTDDDEYIYRTDLPSAAAAAWRVKLWKGRKSDEKRHVLDGSESVRIEFEG
jgi:hypothetical protein